MTNTLLNFESSGYIEPALKVKNAKSYVVTNKGMKELMNMKGYMKMSNILTIGTGGCGNKLLESFLTILDNYEGLQSTYDGLFVNSNINEMSKLSHFNAQMNGLCISGNGTGRSPKKAKESIKLKRSKISNFFASRINNYEVVNIFSSADGGFGNGSITIMSNIIKRLKPNIDINLLIAMPKISSRKASLENALDLYEDILKLKEKDIINSILFIDNDKMVSEDVFNEEVCRLYIESIELGNGALDSNDSKLVNSANGYKVILELNNDMRTMQKAVDNSISNSPFVTPSNFKCTHLGAVIVEEDFNKNEAINMFNPKDFDKTDYGNKNIIVLGGCQLPNEHMNNLKNALEELDNEDRIDEEIVFEGRRKDNKNVSQVKEKVMTKQSLRDMLNDDFWD